MSTVKPEKISTQKAPLAIGPYSQGILLRDHKLIFVSGQLPVDPATMKLIAGDMAQKTRQILDNIHAILHEAGAGMHNIVRMDIFIVNLKENFHAMNEEYLKHFPGPHFPARQTVGVAELPLGSPIEMSAIAAL